MKGNIYLLLLFVPLLALQATTEVVLYPTDDAYVAADLSGNPAGSFISALNFGSSDTLVVGYYLNETGEGEQVINIAFIKFDLSNYGEVRNATLTLTVLGMDSEKPPILQIYYVEDDSWSEGNITFRSSPPPSRLLGEVRITGTGELVLNLTQLFQQDRVVTLALTCRRTDSRYSLIYFASKEAGRDGPVLSFQTTAPDYGPYFLLLPLAALLAVVIKKGLLKKGGAT